MILQSSESKLGGPSVTMEGQEQRRGGRLLEHGPAISLRRQLREGVISLKCCSRRHFFCGSRSSRI